jgi:16S rRNA (guanine1207-N2)-methyltransferase
MIDHPFQLLARKINETDKSLRALWVVDENIGAAEIAAVKPGDYLQVITNRCDVYSVLTAAGFSVQLSDYDFSSIPLSSLDAIFYRVSKEKAVVHYIINAASKYLRKGGGLILAGYKNDGIKTYLAKAAALLGEVGERQRGSKTATMAAVLCRENDGDLLDDKEYQSLSSLAFEGVDFITKPGIFGWNKVDQGSQLLVDQLADEIALMRSPPKTVVDLGCGYGFISVMASRIVKAEFIASDNNMAAINACTENFHQQSVSGSVVVDDCAAGIQLEADLVLCNPPFHQGFDIEDQLTEKFLLATRRLLTGNGVALFVVNRFIPLERKAKKLFKQVETIADNGRFKVVRLANV